MIQKKSTSIDIKHLNRQHILRYIFQRESCSRQDIAADLGMSMPTILANVKELYDLGLVTETGHFDSTGGRKAAVITSVPQAKFALGVDITRNHVSLVLVDLAGHILSGKRISEPYYNDKKYYEKLGSTAREFLAGMKKDDSRFLGTGISIPGIINESGTVITDSHALGVRDLSCGVFKDVLPGNCIFMNDANAAGLAELTGNEQDGPLAYVSLSNSVGGAIFMNGKLYSGNNQRGGEFGHMRLIPGGRKCYCGQEGCADSYLNALQLAAAAGGKLEDFFERLGKGNPHCKKLWAEYLAYLAVAVINLRMIFDCNIILGGYVGAWLEPYLPDLIKQVEILDPFEKGSNYVQLCRYKQESSAFGAAMQHVEQFLERM